MTTKPVLILVPGLLCDETIWRSQAAALSCTYDVRVPDLRRYDRLEAMAEALLLECPPAFSLAGHSMGGRIALEVYRRAPSRVERLALLDTGTHGVRPPEFDHRLRLVRIAKEQGVAAIADEWLLPMVHELHQIPQILDPLRSMVCANSDASFERQISALLARPEATSLLPRISCPVLVATGRHDRWSPPEQHAEIAKAIPGAEMVVFENAGHMSPFESPDEVTGALNHWLSRPVYSSVTRQS